MSRWGTNLGAKGTFAPHRSVIGATVIVGAPLVGVIVIWNAFLTPWAVLTWREAASYSSPRGFEQNVVIHLRRHWRDTCVDVGVGVKRTSPYRTSSLPCPLWIQVMVWGPKTMVGVVGLSTELAVAWSSRNNVKVICGLFQKTICRPQGNIIASKLEKSKVDNNKNRVKIVLN